MNSNLENLGDLFIVGLSGEQLLTVEQTLLERLRPAGVILFKRNFAPGESWTSQLGDLIAAAKKAAGRESFFVSIDHEGGRVHRFPIPVTHFPAAQEWASEAYRVGRAMARELRSLGFNLNFAPVLDIDSEAQNPVIGKRAFASDMSRVIESGKAYLRALTEEGVVACGKHFPGHGGTTTDSHLTLPRVEESSQCLRQRELMPFQELIRGGLKMIMTAHVVYSAFDRENPATCSGPIITKLLRGELGFEGVVISDALEMSALSNFELDQLGKRTLTAGVDMLLVAEPKGMHPLERAVKIAEGIATELKEKRLEEKTIAQACERVSKLFTHLTLLQQPNPPSQYNLSLVGCEEHVKLLAEITRKA